MSFSLPHKKTRIAYHAQWADTAFLVEAMALVVFVMVSLAVFAQLFAVSIERATQGEQLARAVALATDTAERFAARPQDVPEETREGDVAAHSKVTEQRRPGGVLYTDQIEVYSVREDDDGLRDAGTTTDAGPLYTLVTKVYVSGGQHE